MEPVGILPRRSFTIRTENGVYRRISKEEMQHLVRSRIQQARALAERRPRESWVMEKPSMHHGRRPSASSTPTAAASTSARTPGQEYPVSYEAGRPRPIPQTTAAFQNVAANSADSDQDDTIQSSESRYDETPLVQHPFSWSSVEETSDDFSANQEETLSQVDDREDAVSLSDIQGTNGDENNQENLEIVELLTHESEDENQVSSAGEYDAEDYGQPTNCPIPFLSPSQSTRPLPETPVYNNRVLLDNVDKTRQGRSTSPKNNRIIATLVPSSTASPALSPRSNSPENSLHQKRQEMRQAQVESVLRMSLNRVRDRAQNELDQVLEHQDVTMANSDIRQAVSITAREIDQVVQETVRKARQAAQDEISELLKESVQRARMSAEQEILDLVQASVSRVKAQVASESRFDQVGGEEGGNTNNTGEDLAGTLYEDEAEKCVVNESTPNNIDDTEEKATPVIKARPAFLETNLPVQEYRVSPENKGKECSSEAKLNIAAETVAGSSLSPLLISESMEDQNEAGPWTPRGAKQSVPNIQVERQPISQSEVDHFFTKPVKREECEWPYFEHTQSQVERPVARRGKAFPDKTLSAGKALECKNKVLEKQHPKEGMLWHRALDSIEHGHVRLVDGFPVVDTTKDGFVLDEMTWTNDWPKLRSADNDESFVAWEGDRPGPSSQDDSERISAMCSDISLGSEPPGAGLIQNCPKTLQESDRSADEILEKSASDSGRDIASDQTAMVEDSILASSNESEVQVGNQTANVVTNETETGTNADSNLCLSLSIDSRRPFDEPDVSESPVRHGLQSSIEATIGIEENVNKSTEANNVQQPKVEEVDGTSNEEQEISSPEQAETVEEIQTDLEHNSVSNTLPPKALCVTEASTAANEIEDGDFRYPEADQQMKNKVPETEIAPMEKGFRENDVEQESLVEDRDTPRAVFCMDASLGSKQDNVHSAPDESDHDEDEIQSISPPAEQSTIFLGSGDDFGREFGEKAAAAIAASLFAAQSDLLRPSTSPETVATEDEPPSTQSSLGSLATKEPTSIEEKILRRIASQLLNDYETRDSHALSQLESARGDSVISPLSLPTVYSSDNCLDGDRIRQFTANIQNACTEGPISPCRSLPNQQEIVGVFCTNILDVMRADSDESQTIITLQTPSIQTFDGSTLADDNSYFTSAVETWMESVADRIEGNAPSPRQRRQRQPVQPKLRQSAQQKRSKPQKNWSGKNTKELSSVAKEWLWSLGEKFDVAVDHINEVLGNKDARSDESESEMETLPLLSEIKRSSFSFSDGGQGQSVEVDIAVEDTKAERARYSMQSFQPHRNKRENGKKIPAREPMRPRRRQRGRSRQKRGIV